MSGIYLGFIEKALLFGKSKIIFRLLGSALIIISLFLIIQPKGNTHSIIWMPYSPNQVKQAATDKKPVIIDFTADWCAACKELEEGAFSSREAIKRSERFVRLRLDGTNTNKPEVKSAGQKYNIKGYPTVIFIKTNGDVDKTASFAGFVDTKDFLKRINSIK